MPLYEYQCRKCGHRFERIQKFTDPPPKKCLECGGKVDQLISSPAVHFKGSGFYATDYGRKGSGTAGGADGTAKEGASPTGDDSSAGKAREKTDSSPSSSSEAGREVARRGDSERSRHQDSERTKSRDKEESRSKSPEKKSSKK